ncbi:transcription factor [compost metagenome]
MIGSKIAEARRKLNISQAELAEQLFISPQAVGKWERGESLPDLITFSRLAKIMGVDLNYFSEDFGSVDVMVSSSKDLIENREKLSIAKQKSTFNWDMSRGNWVDADFSGLKNLYEKFSSSNMQRCKFIGSDMSGLLLKNNNVEGCDFSSSDFNASHIQNSNVSNNLFQNCSLQEAEFSGSYISGSDFTGTDFTRTIIKSGGMEKSIIANAVWNGTSFNDTQLADMVFDGTLNDCSFENCAFTRVTFQNAILTNTFFKCKSLKRIKFINCQADRITYEFLKNGKADLNGIILISLSNTKTR